MKMTFEGTVEDAGASLVGTAQGTLYHGGFGPVELTLERQYPSKDRR